MNSTLVDAKPWYREPWPWILMSGPLLVIVAAIVTAWIAFTHNDGLVAEDYYKQGLAVNQVLGREERALSLGLYADLMRSGQQLRVLIGGGSEYRPPASVNLRIVHPTRAGEDQVLTLVPDGQGFYSGKLAHEFSGRWTVSLEDASGLWRLTGRWHADAEGSRRLLAGDEHAVFNRPLTGSK